MTCRCLAVFAAAAILPTFALTATAAAQGDPPPPCPPGEVPNTTIRGFDIEDSGGKLTATHTIGLGLHGPDGEIPNVAFTLPPQAQNRGDESNPAFSIDKPGPVAVSASWSEEVESDSSTCTASTEGTLRLRPPRALTFAGLPARWRSFADSYSMAFRTGKNADLRPIELRLSGVRRAHPPGPRARVQRVTLALRRGDAGLARGGRRTMRTAGWRFDVSNVDEHTILINVRNIEDLRGRRVGGSRAFGYSIVLVQAGRRVGRERVTGHCGYLGCNWRAL